MPPTRLHPVEAIFNARGWGLLESHHDEGFFMDWRTDPFPKLLLAIGGEGWLELAGRCVPISSGTLLAIPKGRKHRLADKTGEPLSIYGVCLDLNRFPAADLARQVCGHLRVECAADTSAKARAAFRELLLEEREELPGCRDLQMAIISRLLILLLRSLPGGSTPQANSRQRVEQYVRRLQSRFWQTQDLDQAARELGLSRRRFTQLFREATGTSWLDHLTGLRMAHALKLLRTTRLSVRSIAFECGYGDLSHFYRLFKSTHGTTPGETR